MVSPTTPMWVNGHPYPDPIHVETFTGLASTGFLSGSVVVADDTGELRVALPPIWITYAGSFSGGKSFAQRVAHSVGVTEFTLGAPADVVAVDDTMLPGATPIIALGGDASLAEGGYVAVIEPNFVVAGTPVAGLTTESVDNVEVNGVDVFNLATGEEIETVDGSLVFGLLQALDDVSSVDGVAVAAAAAENLQISFVYWDKSTPSVLTSYTLPTGSYGFRVAANHNFLSLSYSALLAGGDLLPDLSSGGNATVTEVTTATYNTTATDQILSVTRTTTGACAITIRTADIVDGREIEIVDEGLNAGTYNITIVGQGGELIQGLPTLTLDRDGEGVQLYARNGALYAH